MIESTLHALQIALTLLGGVVAIAVAAQPVWHWIWKRQRLRHLDNPLSLVKAISQNLSYELVYILSVSNGNWVVEWANHRWLEVFDLTMTEAASGSFWAKIDNGDFTDLVNRAIKNAVPFTGTFWLTDGRQVMTTMHPYWWNGNLYYVGSSQVLP